VNRRDSRFDPGTLNDSEGELKDPDVDPNGLRLYRDVFFIIFTLLAFAGGFLTWAFGPLLNFKVDGRWLFGGGVAWTVVIAVWLHNRCSRCGLKPLGEKVAADGYCVACQRIMDRRRMEEDRRARSRVP
jgi:hypothetical protein